MLGKSTPNLQIRERRGPPDPEIKEGGGGRPPKKKTSALGASVWSKIMVVAGGSGRAPLDPPLVITETELWIISVS